MTTDCIKSALKTQINKWHLEFILRISPILDPNNMSLQSGLVCESSVVWSRKYPLTLSLDIGKASVNDTHIQGSILTVLTENNILFEW